MKVKNAAQVFSQRVSATMRYLASKGRFFYRNSFSVYLGMSLLGAGVPESAVDTVTWGFLGQWGQFGTKWQF
jgi:hypothetical protein